MSGRSKIFPLVWGACIGGVPAVFSLLLGSSAALAELYMAPLDRAAWLVEKSAVSCRLHHAVPKYGDAIFETLAGTPQRFYTAVEQNPMQSGPSALIAYPPSWNPERPERQLGSVEVSEGRQPIALDEVQSERLLDALRAGLVPQLTRPAQGDAEAVARLGLSPVNFQRAYLQYDECIAQLLPFSFEQMTNTPIRFERDRADLDAAARKKIDLLLRYVKAERRPLKIDIDALSDDTFRRLGNLELAKSRVQNINDYLVARGIAPASIRTTYRTERGGNDSNRRYVTIRLRRAAAPANTKAAVPSAVAASDSTAGSSLR